MHIVIVEDEEDIADLISFALEREGLHVKMAHDGATGVQLIRAERPDMVILDVMMPEKDGFQVFTEMKSDSLTENIPVLFLTARSQLDDKLKGLELGADDYMTKPFSPKELVQRVKNILARHSKKTPSLIMSCHDLLLDKNTLRVTLDNETLDLTTAEFKLLSYMLERDGKVQDRYDLQKVLFGYADTTQSRALDTHIKRLRQKLSRYAICIETERGVGYRFNSKVIRESSER